MSTQTVIVIESSTIHTHYFLKSELVSYCKVHQLPTSGSKETLRHRISYYLETGNIFVEKKEARGKTHCPNIITKDTVIETNFICSQKHRAFFKAEIGSSFTFKVAFQTWLKEHSGKTYQDALIAFTALQEAQKHTPTKIGKQFEYNAYIRAFFEANKGKTLQEAIQCWNYKKHMAGHHRYEDSDLNASKAK